jgi:hypothetical protein
LNKTKIQENERSPLLKKKDREQGGRNPQRLPMLENSKAVL